MNITLTYLASCIIMLAMAQCGQSKSVLSGQADVGFHGSPCAR